MTLSFALLGAVLQIFGGVSVGSYVGPQLQPPASTSPAKDKCTITGVVTSMQTGEALKKVTLHLTLRNNSRNSNGVPEQTGYSGASNPDGSFKFEAIEPGEYSLSGERTGYVRTEYGSKGGMFSPGTTLNLAPGQKLLDVKLQLTAQAAITGRVLDEDGDPAGGVQVQAYGRAWVQGAKASYFPMGQATTDDTGSYRISGLSPGKYYVSTETLRNQMMGMREKPAEPGKPEIAPVTTFYPSSLDRAGATAVQVNAGQEMPGIEIRMRSVQTFHIRGKVAGESASGENGRMQTMLMLTPGGDTGGVLTFFRGMTAVGKDGAFDMGNVAPGPYVITADFGGTRGSIRQIVEVSSGDVNDLVLTIQPTFTIHGSVELQGTLPRTAKDKALENITVTLTSDEAMTTLITLMSSVQGQTKADGSFLIENVMPGKFRVQVMNKPEAAYVKSVRFGSQEVLGKTLDLSQAAGGDLRVTLRAGAAEVSGTVMAKKGDDSGSSAMVPASRASVLLIPEDVTRDGGDVHTTGTNQNGGFTESGITPGVYYAVAYAPDEYRDLDDTVILKQLIAKGTKLEVRENDKQQVQVTLIPAEELQAALTAAGAEN